MLAKILAADMTEVSQCSYRHFIFNAYRAAKTMNTEKQESLSKVPEVTLVFWIIKILATTLGETAGDAVSMSMDLGYLVSTGIFSVIFMVAVVAQVAAKKFHPFLYWITIIATTTLVRRWQISRIASSVSVTRAEQQFC